MSNNLRREAELMLAEGYKILARTSDLDCDPEVKSRRIRDGYMWLAKGHALLAESETVSERTPDSGSERTPDGHNCALANGYLEKNCQVCKGKCPDRSLSIEAEKTKLALAERDEAYAALRILTQVDLETYELRFTDAPTVDLFTLCCVAHRAAHAPERCLGDDCKCACTFCAQGQHIQAGASIGAPEEMPPQKPASITMSVRIGDVWQNSRKRKFRLLRWVPDDPYRVVVLNEAFDHECVMLWPLACEKWQLVVRGDGEERSAP